MKDWREEHSSQQPEEFEQISDGTFMQRRNIRKVDHEKNDDQPAYSEYVCECREMTAAEYAEFWAKRNAADAAYAIMLAGGDLDE